VGASSQLPQAIIEYTFVSSVTTSAVRGFNVTVGL